MGPLHRKMLIVTGVVLFHALALWALQAGMPRRKEEGEIALPVVIQLITPPAPRMESPPPPATMESPAPPPPRKRPPVPRPATRKAVRTPPAAPRPAPTLETRPLAEDPSRADVTEPAPGPPAATAAAGQTSPEPGPASPSPAKVELPSTDASYLQNPAPVYPPISKRLGEQGRVVVRVLIGADGIPQKADLKLSSGFERLDRSALEYVMRCRYVPGKVGGVPQAMWYEAPVSFVLE